VDLRGEKWREAGEDCITPYEFRNLYPSPNIIPKSRMGCVGHVARMGDEKCIQYFCRKT
jgi:hypothetical protein